MALPAHLVSRELREISRMAAFQGRQTFLLDFPTEKVELYDRLLRTPPPPLVVLQMRRLLASRLSLTRRVKP
jgi:hypothetical protein